MNSITSYLSQPATQIATAAGAIAPVATYACLGPLSWTGLALATIGGQAIAHASTLVVPYCQGKRRLNSGLQRWCEEIPKNTPEYQQRLQAKDRIMECFLMEGTGLELQDLNLSSLPPEIGSLTRLERLNASKNQLAALPPELGSLINLKYLSLNDNRLQSCPEQIRNLTNLRRLDLSNNQLTTLPDMGPLPHFYHLNLNHNPHLTSLPSSISSIMHGHSWIELTGCPISEHTWLQIQNSITADNYNGPLFVDLSATLPDRPPGPPPIDRRVKWAS